MGVARVHSEDLEGSGAETVLPAEGYRVARLDVVLHGPTVSCSRANLQVCQRGESLRLITRGEPSREGVPGRRKPAVSRGFVLASPGESW